MHCHSRHAAGLSSLSTTSFVVHCHAVGLSSLSTTSVVVTTGLLCVVTL